MKLKENVITLSTLFIFILTIAGCGHSSQKVLFLYPGCECFETLLTQYSAVDELQALLDSLGISVIESADPGDSCGMLLVNGPREVFYNWPMSVNELALKIKNEYPLVGFDGLLQKLRNITRKKDMQEKKKYRENNIYCIYDAVIEDSIFVQEGFDELVLKTDEGIGKLSDYSFYLYTNQQRKEKIYLVKHEKEPKQLYILLFWGNCIRARRYFP